MKFKRYIYILGLIIAFVGFNACQEDALIDPSPSPTVPEGCIGVFFPKSNTANFEFEPSDATVFELTIAREVTTASAEVPLVVEVNTDDVFVVPATANFPAGEETTTVKITFPTAKESVTYSLGLKVEGDQYVNPYSTEKPVVSTSVTRIKWETLDDPMIYLDGTFNSLFGTRNLPVYVSVEMATLGKDVRYRFKNAYNSMPSSEEPDSDGIYDGFPFNEPGDFDEGNDYYTVVEIKYKKDESPEGIDNTRGEVLMLPYETGIDWSYGMVSVGSVTNKFGVLANDKILFESGSVYMSMANYNGGRQYSDGLETIIYLTKEAYIADNMSITDFNKVEYEVVEGEVGKFESKAFDFLLDKTLMKAVDIDAENKDSEYKDLYYISELYADKIGLAFYYDGDENLSVINNQYTGTEFVGKKVYVSSSKDILTKVSKNDKGITIFEFGLNFHFADGTSLGDFAETYYYSKDAVVYEKEDFIGNFVMTGPSQFGGEPAAKMNVKFVKGDNNDILIEGVDWAKEIVAVYNAANSTISIEPQELADVERQDGSIWNDVLLYTVDLEGDVSVTASMVFNYDLKGNIVLSDDTEADGYLIESEIAGGELAGYHSLQFTPAPAPAPKSTRSAFSNEVTIKSFDKSSVTKVVRGGNNLKIQGKVSPKKIINTNAKVAF